MIEWKFDASAYDPTGERQKEVEIKESVVENVTETALFEWKNEEFSVRSVEMGGEPWFVAKDVCDMLGYGNPWDAVARHVDSEDKNTLAIHDGKRGNPNMTVVNESGLYALIFGSDLPAAKQFKRWVTHEVLPAIRKEGYYSIVSDEELVEKLCDKLLTDRDNFLKVMQKGRLGILGFHAVMMGVSPFSAELSPDTQRVYRAAGLK